MKKPIVLIVDDDPDFGMRLKKSFAIAAEWGCLFIDDLAEALEILHSDRYDIRILLTDWHFSAGFDQAAGLLDGVDLVEKVQASCPNVECFLMTAQQSSPSFDSKAAKLNSVRIMFKMNFELASSTRMQEAFSSESNATEQPWQVIEDNLVELSPRRNALDESDNNSSEFDTYIQEMPSGIQVIKPIPVIVRIDHDEAGTYFRASAPQLGLLVEGFGDDPNEAQEELKDVIASQFYGSPEDVKLEGLAALSQKLLHEHLVIFQNQTKQKFNYG